VAGAAAAAGCATTQQEAARLQLNSARIRASELPVRVTRGNPAVVVASVTLVPAGSRHAVVVVLRNPAAAPITDLPISVGIRARSGTRTYLNDRAGLPYFSAHIPSIPGDGSLTWVLMTARPLPHGAHPFATVGFPPSPPLSDPSTLPRISAAAVTHGQSSGAGNGTLQLNLVNASGVPQYELQVYAVARRGRRIVAAAATTVPHLGSNGRTTLRLPWLGKPNGAAPQLEAPPTIFN
jgi:hypothetical protein